MNNVTKGSASREHESEQDSDKEQHELDEEYTVKINKQMEITPKYLEQAIKEENIHFP